MSTSQKPMYVLTSFSISLTLDISTLATALHVTNMVIFGSKVASMVR